MNHITIATDDLKGAELAQLMAIVLAAHRRRHPEPCDFHPESRPAAASLKTENRTTENGSEATRIREPGDDDEPVEEEKPPTDGRQLLGWAGQQVPDAMPAIKQWGMRKKIKARIVDWSQRDVLACYAHVRGTMR